MDLLQVFHAQFPIVLRAFHGLINGGHAACNQTLHHFRIGGIGGRAFYCVQNAQTARGAAANVNEPSALMELFGDYIHRFGDLGADGLHSLGYLVIFAVD